MSSPEIIQFIVTNLNPDFERKFEISKKKFGSHFIFHGSSCENWYSILRNGIRVCSNTKYMTAGAARGAGVYGSSQFMTSYGYSNRYMYMGPQGAGSAPGSGPAHTDVYPGFSIMGLMEVIIEGPKPELSIACIPKNEYVALRYVLLIPSGAAGSTNVDSTAMGLDGHYYGYIGRLKTASKTLNQDRITNNSGIDT